MEEPSDVQALECISSELGESQIKIILSSQCIKAQIYLVNKLRKQSEQRKVECDNIKKENLKLETEINIAQQKIKSSIMALETIKSANTELKKELLLTKERKSQVVERVRTGIAKYKNMWEESKRRYENIPFIKNFLETKNQNLALQEEINILNQEEQNLVDAINKERNTLLESDKKLIIEIADYFINQRPKAIAMIKEKQDKIDELNKNIQESLKNTNNDIPAPRKLVEKLYDPKDRAENSLKKLNEKDVTMLPLLHMGDYDLATFTNKLDQIKKEDCSNSITMTRYEVKTNVHHNFKEKSECSEDIADFKPEEVVKNSKNNSKRKLINILDDIMLNKAQTRELVSKLKSGGLQNVDATTQKLKITSIDDEKSEPETIDKDENAMETEPIEETNMSTHSSNILVPPTQFLDMSQKVSSVSANVTHDEKNINDPQNEDKIERTEEKNINVTSEENLNVMKDNILKKHNLDLSPEFKYPKRQMKSSSGESVTSKFFKKDVVKVIERDISDTKNENTESAEESTIKLSNNVKNKEIFKNTNDLPLNCSSPKNEVLNTEKPVSGLLFHHGPDGIMESLDMSISTTGYEDGDMDFPHCMDASLLLSPKADIPETNENIGEVTSQEVPNFLSGLKKTGLSFFGRKSDDSHGKSETNIISNENNFNFTFDEEKKSRGGLFSMFQ